MLPILVSKLAPLLTVIEIVPQMHKVVKNKRVRDLSFWTIFLMFFSGIVWALHGYFIQDITLLLSSFAVIILNALMMFIYLIYAV
jgi:uncharacterized protein with PQ loop repeat